MSKKGTALSTRSCPHCGFILTFGEKEETIECPKCLNEVAKQYAPESNGNTNVTFNDNSASIAINSGVNKNPESVVIFLEDFFEVEEREEYEDFHAIGSSSINPLIKELKLTSGNDPATWEAAFYSVLKPSFIRFALLDKYKDRISESIKDKNEEDTVKYFEDYAEAMKALQENKEKILAELERYLARYEGQSSKEDKVKELKQELKKLKDLFDKYQDVPESIDDMGELKDIKDNVDEEIEKEYEEQGLSAKNMYEKAKEFEEAGQNNEALVLYQRLGNYKDSRSSAIRLNAWVRYKSLLHVNGTSFVIQKHVDEIIKNKRQAKKVAKEESENERHGQKYDIVSTKIGDYGVLEPTEDVLISNYQARLNIFGTYFYYISKKGTIHSYDLLKRQDSELESFGHHLENKLNLTFDNNTKGLLLSYVEKEKRSLKDIKKLLKKKDKTSEDLEPSNYNSNRIDILNYGSSVNFFEPLIDHIHEVEKFDNGSTLLGDYIKVSRYEFEQRKISRKNKPVYKIKHQILVNVKTKKTYEDLLDLNEKIVYIKGDEIYFTRFAPSKYNLALIKKDIESGEETIVLENIFSVEKIVDEKVFYTIGNTDKKDFYYYNMEKEESSLVLESFTGYSDYSAGYFYLYRGSKFNITLFKVKEDGSQTIVLASNIDRKGYSKKIGGYFYYQDVYDQLCCVRIDGQNHRVIAEDVHNVIKANDKEVYYSISETTDQLDSGFLKGKNQYKYRRAYSIYKYDIANNKNEKLLFGVDDWYYIASRDTLYYVKTNEEVYKTVNLKVRKQYNYNTIQDDYYITSLSNIEEKRVLSIGLPHQDKHYGCFLIRLFMRNKDNKIKFEKLPWKRPYMEDKEELFV